MGKRTTSEVGRPVREQLGANVKRIRGERTQSAFAARVGLSQAVISRIESGNYPGLDIETVVKIAVGAEVSLVDDLLFGCEMAMSIVRYEQDRAA